MPTGWHCWLSWLQLGCCQAHRMKNPVCGFSKYNYIYFFCPFHLMGSIGTIKMTPHFISSLRIMCCILCKFLLGELTWSRKGLCPQGIYNLVGEINMYKLLCEKYQRRESALGVHQDKARISCQSRRQYWMTDIWVSPQWGDYMTGRANSGSRAPEMGGRRTCLQSRLVWHDCGW